MTKHAPLPKAGKPVDDAAKANAIEAAALQQASAISNHEAVRNAALGKFAALGSIEARGAMSLIRAAILYNQLCADGTFTDADADKVYGAYADGYDRRAASNHGLQDKASRKAQVSTFRTFGKPEVLPHGDVYKRVSVIRAQISKDDVYGSPYNCLVKVNREIIAACKELTDYSKLVVTDDMLRGWLTKATPVDKSDADKLDKAIEAVRKLAASGKFAGLAEHAEKLQEFAVSFRTGQKTAERVMESLH